MRTRSASSWLTWCSHSGARVPRSVPPPPCSPSPPLVPPGTRTVVPFRDVTQRLLIAILVLAPGVCPSRPAAASVVVPLSLVQLTETADLVVDATVVDVRSQPGPEGIERVVQVLVTSTWKGRTDA